MTDEKLQPVQKPHDAETERQIEIMRKVMRRYRNALRELAKQ